MEERIKAGFEGPWWSHPPLRNALVSGVIAGAGFVLAHLGLIGEIAENAFYWLAIPVGAYHWAREGVEELFQEQAVGIEILMLAATVGSGILGLWDEAAALVILYGAADGIEEYTYARTRHAIRSLLDLAPKQANLLRGGQEITVPAEDLKPGDVFIVRPGEMIPTDGIIISGTSSLDESSLTGEAVPVDKGPGTKVFAASINRQGALTIEATAAFADNTLSKIIHLVEQAQEQKGQAQRWIERFGRRYSPAVLVVSLLFLLVPWVFDLPWGEWSLRAVILLVAAAPCALVMSMPMAMAAGIGSGGKRGVLMKGGAHLEHLGEIRVVAFDKTGTLTHGKLVVTDLICFGGTEAKMLVIAAGLEHFSEHPIAKGVVEKARTQAISPAEVTAFEALAGAGAKGVIQGETWYVGNPDLFMGLGVNLDYVAEAVRSLQEEGKTVVLLGTREKVTGLMALEDRVRPGVRGLVDNLHAAGVRVAMLTGDNARTAKALAMKLGIDDFRADLKPEDKVAAVRQLEKQYGAVLMVGDGVNDAPALAAATCGVAMGAAGSDVAIEAADVALMADDPSKVLEALALGRKARRISTQNIAFSIMILIVLIPLALAGSLTVAVAVIVHEGSELLAVANGIRAGRIAARP